MSNEIVCNKFYVKDIFKKWYKIPEYQRPYVWGSDQIIDLLEDISYAQQNNKNSEYFLGSIVLQSKKNDTYIEDNLLDGQQRLTTLLLITAVIRDLSNDEDLQSVCKSIIFQKGNKYNAIPERIRIVFDIRSEVKDFVDKFIKPDSALKNIESLKAESKQTKNLSIKNMINAILIISNYFKRVNVISPEDFFHYLNNKALMISVSSTNLEDAFKLFTVMNDRGIKLRNSDILKAENLNLVSEVDREKWAIEWEKIENDLHEDFDGFLSHLRTILVKEKARKNLLSEFEENIYFTRSEKTPLLCKGVDTFIYVKKYKKYYDQLFNEEHYAQFDNFKFDNLVSIMRNVLPADLWIPPLLSYYDKFKEEKLVDFLEKLDNKFSSDWIVGLTPTTRIENMNEILKEIEKSSNSESILNNKDIFQIDRSSFIEILKGNIYGRRFTRYILYKLDYLYGNSDKINVPNIITVEHILPQNPHETSQWNNDFSNEDREFWTNKLGNLVLISRRKNSSQGRLDYVEKKTKYFKNNIELFRNSLRLFNEYILWTPSDIKRNQEQVISKLEMHYFKN